MKRQTIKRDTPQNSMVKLSVIIPTYNEEKDIAACVESLQKQSHKDFEIIIVDDGSTDNTLEIVARYTKVKVLHQNHNGPGSARNLGAKGAKGKILIFIDADMTFSKDYLKNLIAPIKKEVIGTTHDQEIVVNTENLWSRCWGKVRVNPKSAEKVKIFRAIRKDIFLARGGFDPMYGYADDQTLWYKHGLKPVVAKNTLCYHKNPTTLKGVFRQSRWIGASIDSFFIRNAPLNYLIPLILALLTPLAIPLMVVKKILTTRDVLIFFPLFAFMTARYIGTISGLIRKIYLERNY